MEPCCSWAPVQQCCWSSSWPCGCFAAWVCLCGNGRHNRHGVSADGWGSWFSVPTGNNATHKKMKRCIVAVTFSWSDLQIGDELKLISWVSAIVCVALFAVDVTGLFGQLVLGDTFAVAVALLFIAKSPTGWCKYKLRRLGADAMLGCPLGAGSCLSKNLLAAVLPVSFQLPFLRS